MHTGVLIEFPSATPLAPSGVTGDGVSWRKISSSGIIDEPLVQGGADRHREPAAHLAVAQVRVQNSPGVVQAHILVDANRAGITVDLDPAEIEDEAERRSR
jgi:hypothetical protein